MINAGPFSLDALSSHAKDGERIDEPLSRWVGAMKGVADGRDGDLVESLARLPQEHAAPALWRAWSEGQTLRDYESLVGPDWDREDRSWLLPVLWASVDQACWRHRYCLAERLAKRAVGRSLELPSLSAEWATLSYLSLARVYFAQDRLNLAGPLMENLPPHEGLEIRGLVALHRGELQRLLGERPSSAEFTLARQWLTAPAQALSATRQDLSVVAGADELFGASQWAEASLEYRTLARTLSGVHPGDAAEGPFAPVPLAWPCLPGMAYPWPTAFVTCGQVGLVQAYLHCQGQLARCLRSLGQEAEAKIEARQAKAVRSTRGMAQLVAINQKTFPDTAMLRVTVSAPGRRPVWVSWDSARGELETVSPQRLTSKLLLLGTEGQYGEQFLMEFFSRPFPENEVELRFYGRKAKSSQLEAVAYALWIGFEQGPPLYLPVS